VQGALLHQAHIEAVQARGARDQQRAVEAKARRLRVEASSCQRLVSRFGETAKRDALQSELKKQAAAERAQKQAQRANEARQARGAMEQARAQKLSSASERIEDSSRRAAAIVEATAAKNAHLVKRALATVAAHREQQRESAEAAGFKIAARQAAATERRNEALERELASPRTDMERVEMARAELAKQEIELLDQKLELERSLCAATERRASNIAALVDKARADISRVQAAHDNKLMLAAEAEVSMWHTIESIWKIAIRRAGLK